MFRLDWVAYREKPADEVKDIYDDLLEMEAEGEAGDFVTLNAAADLVMTDATVAWLRGFPDAEWNLWAPDVMEFFLSVDDAVEAVANSRIGIVDFYCTTGDPALAMRAEGDRVGIYAVDWEAAIGIDPEGPLPGWVLECPRTDGSLEELRAYVKVLKGEFARAVVRYEPRMAGHEPMTAWLAMG